jgi:N-methylhydantoinase A
MRGQKRPNIYDVSWDRLPPLVPRSLRLEVRERIPVMGASNSPDPKETLTLFATSDAHVEAIVVSFINAYLNPTHERQVGQLIAEIAPHGGLFIVRHSSEIREYERTSTTDQCLTDSHSGSVLEST